MKKYLLLFLSLSIGITSCTDHDDVVIESNIVVQDFMWQAMNFWYFWQSEVPNLADTKFSTNKAYDDFLKSESDPSAFFKNLKFSEDLFSVSNDDYKTLVNSFAGISKSNGLEFGLVDSASRGLFGIVRYVIPNSNAAAQDISRGEVFNSVNGQILTLGNHKDLLFGDNDTYTLNMADITATSITPNGKNVTLIKEEGLNENPIFITKTIETNGEKIGYLMYNQFTNEYDAELNAAFGQLKADGVTDLVLDLRYNPGGSVNSSRLLSSMVYGTDTANLFLRQIWNTKLNDQLSSEDYFASTLENGAAINTLNLTKVYVLVSPTTASASELVINGLRPYMSVFLIGTKTTGKNEFSITMVDDPNRSDAPFVYTQSREGRINPLNNWAIQPIVGRNENAVGFSDYTAGFTPDILLPEDLTNYGVLGSVDEPLLARAIQEITGVSTKKDFTVKSPTDLLTSSKMFTPLKDNMYLDKKINIRF